jgi:hypothetical protein
MKSKQTAVRQAQVGVKNILEFSPNKALINTCNAKAPAGKPPGLGAAGFLAVTAG